MSAEAGERLRAARAGKGLSVDDVAAALKVPARYIDAIERHDATGLPELTFVRGYVRGYARLVGLDPEPLVALLDPVQIKAPRQQVGIADMPARKTGNRPALPAGPMGRRHHRIAAAILLLGAAGWVTWTAFEPDLEWPFPPTPEATESAATAGQLLPRSTELALPGSASAGPAPTGTPAAAPLEAPPPAVPGASSALPAQTTDPVAVPAPGAAAMPVVPAQPMPQPGVPPSGLFVRFSGDCWIEVRDADNQVIHHSNRSRGMDFALQGKEPLTVTLGNAANAEVFWNGDPVKVDAFSRGGVARVNVGRASR